MGHDSTVYLGHSLLPRGYILRVGHRKKQLYNSGNYPMVLQGTLILYKCVWKLRILTRYLPLQRLGFCPQFAECRRHTMAFAVRQTWHTELATRHDAWYSIRICDWSSRFYIYIYIWYHQYFCESTLKDAPWLSYPFQSRVLLAACATRRAKPVLKYWVICVQELSWLCCSCTWRHVQLPNGTLPEKKSKPNPNDWGGIRLQRFICQK